jgi:MscS family membrane protein
VDWIADDGWLALRFLRVELWQWIALLLLVVVAYLLSWIALRAAQSVLRALLRRRGGLEDELFALAGGPVRALGALAVFAGGALLLGLEDPALRLTIGLVKGLAIVAVAWFLVRVIGLTNRRLRARLEREGRRTAVAMLPLGEKTVKVALIALALIAFLQNIGFNVTGVLAGLGIGGLAVALAAQKSVENLFGGMSIVLDQPVRVGDQCRFGALSGTVEDIGLRTTKIRTAERTVVSVPNAEFAQMQLENYTVRDKFLFTTTLGLGLESTPSQVRAVLAGVKRLLSTHPEVDPEQARVRLVKYGVQSLDLELFAYLRTSDNDEFLALREGLLLEILEIVAASGTSLAVPATRTYLAEGNGLESGRLVGRAAQRSRRPGASSWAAEYPAHEDEAHDGH